MAEYGWGKTENEGVQIFPTGATRSPEADKLDYEGFLSPIVLETVAEYMHNHRYQSDGKFRDSDNWQKGIPLSSYMKSLLRHTVTAWKAHRGYKTDEDLVTSLSAVIFNASGYIHELKKSQSS